MSPRVTIVVATYGRPDALVCALQSVFQQTLTDWQLWVIGDGCSADTGAALQPFLADPRVRYINLPWRCGAQALPNSAGMLNAQTDFIALLNHDDLWLPTHLETACQRLDPAQPGFFFGRSAWIWQGPADPGSLPVIETVSLAAPDFATIFQRGFHAIEPASTWVLTRVLVRKVGPWRSGSGLYRASIQDWALRAWRAGARLAAGEAVSCLKFEDHWSNQAPGLRYAIAPRSQQALLGAISDPARLAALQQQLAMLAQQPQAAGRRMSLDLALGDQPMAKQLAQWLITPHTAQYFHQTGLDAYNWMCAEWGLARGWREQAVLQRRTGETPPREPGLDQVVQHVAQALSDAPGSRS